MCRIPGGGGEGGLQRRRQKNWRAIKRLAIYCRRTSDFSFFPEDSRLTVFGRSDEDLDDPRPGPALLVEDAVQDVVDHLLVGHGCAG